MSATKKFENNGNEKDTYMEYQKEALEIFRAHYEERGLKI